MPEEDEWFYGADLRFEGRQVLTRGDALRADQLTLEAEAAVRVRRIEADFQAFEQEKQVRLAASFFTWGAFASARGRVAPARRSQAPDRPGRPSHGAFDASAPSPRRPTPSPRPLTFLRSRRRPLMKKELFSRPSSRN